MEKGLYKEQNGQLMYATNAIYFPDDTVIQVKDHIKKKEGTEVVDGWKVFYTREAALRYFGITETLEEVTFGTRSISQPQCNSWWCRFKNWIKKLIRK
jgi:hypothetical protein